MIEIKIFKENKGNRYLLIAVLSLIFVIISFSFVSNNEKYYKKTIAKVAKITIEKETKTQDMNGNTDTIIYQHVYADVMNGRHKGDKIQMENKTSYSKAYDLDLKKNDEVFITYKEGADGKIKSASVQDFKRDKYFVYISVLFILFILIIGKAKGFRSFVSLAVNMVIVYFIVKLYLAGCNMFLISSLASILFIVLSILIVSGKNKKSFSAIISTIVGTSFSMAIALIVINVSGGKGIHYEEMEFLTHPPEQIFMSEILIGVLGAIMDIAISMSSAIEELYEKNPGIDSKTLVKSGMEIGKDIMGTMANTLVFAYASGSMPIIILWLKNSYPVSYIVNINICLEVIRALTGSIGIVVSIPITLFISMKLLKGRMIGDESL